MKVKAQGLLNAAEYVRATYGESAVREVLHGCSRQVQDRCSMSVTIEWHPIAEFIEFLEVAETILEVPRGELARACGAAGARMNTRGVVRRAVFHLGTPAFLLKRIAGMWGQFNDAGEMELLHLDDKYGLIEVRDVPEPNVLFCDTLTGWAEVVSETIGLVRPSVIHEQCRARGCERCTWRIKWRGLASDKHSSALERLGTTVVPQRRSREQ